MYSFIFFLMTVTLRLQYDRFSVLCFLCEREFRWSRPWHHHGGRKSVPFALCLCWVKCLCPHIKGISDILMILLKKKHTKKTGRSTVLSREADHDQDTAARNLTIHHQGSYSHSGSLLRLTSTNTVRSYPVLCHWSWKQPEGEIQSFRFHWLFVQRDGTPPYL